MNILVIDGQGGRLGCQMVRSIAEKYPGARLMAVGTNSAAAAAMAKAGAHQAAAGENPLFSGNPDNIRMADAVQRVMAEETGKI